MDYTSTILIVDDESDIRQMLQEFLAGEGYHLAFASSGAEALAQASSLIPDLILLDVLMPGMNGFEVCRRLRADPLLADRVPLSDHLDPGPRRTKKADRATGNSRI